MAEKQQSLQDIIKQEYKNCMIDPAHFVRKYCKIQHPIRGSILFKMFPFQEDALKDFQNHRFNAILKSRQTGISTLTAAYALWLILFHDDKNVLVIATKQDTAKNLVTKVRHMHSNLPVWLKGKALEDNKLSLRFANGSQIKAISSSGEAGRSEALSLLIFDEAAFIDKIDEIWKASSSTLATGGTAIAVSTPNGMGNWFHQTWQKALAKEKIETKNNVITWNPINIHWSLHPERDQDWRDQQTELLGEKGSAQECDCDFIASGHTVIPGEVIQFYKDTYVEEPLERRGMGSNLWVWEPVDYNRKMGYLVVADVARGDGADYSAYHVFDLETMTQVAEFKGKVTTKIFGNMLLSIATEYNDALLVVENATVGWHAIQVVIDRGYPNLFYMSNDLKYVDVEHQMNINKYDPDTKMVAGFTTSARTRPLIISKLDEYFRDKAVTIKSIRTIEELFTFNWLNGKAQALRGYNDDLVMPLGIGLWVRDTAIKLKQEGIDLTAAAISSISVKRPYDGMYNSLDSTGGSDPYKMDVGNGDEEDLRWLLG